MTRQPDQRVTMRDVAQRAGVSTATVSYVLNDTPGQSLTESTRARVLGAAADLHYVLHAPGRAMRQGTSRTVIAEVGELDHNGPTLGKLLRAMSAELRAHDPALVITVGGDGNRDEIAGTIAPRAVLDFTRVALGTALDDLISGTTEGVHAGYPYQSLTKLRYLAERGHERAAVVLPVSPRTDLTDLRLRHWLQAAIHLGLPEPRAFRLPPRDPGRLLRSQLIEPGYTAVACYDYATAVRVIHALDDMGLRCPEDVAVMGFDDSDVSELSRPGVTTIRIDAAEYGRRAAQVALGFTPEPWGSPPSTVLVRASA